MFTEKLEIALKTVQRVGCFLLENRQNLQTITAKASPNDFVTNLDREAQELVFRELSRKLPDDRYWGEESETERDEVLDRLWVLDPIDGTTNYIYDLPAYAISLAYFHENRPVIGIIHLPVLNETYWAIRGKGSFRNGTPIQVSPVDEIGEALIVTGYPYHPERRNQERKYYDTLLPLCRDFRAFGSAAVGLAYVACGRSEAFFEPELNFYDVAAGIVLIEEAGGVSSDLWGKPWSHSDTSLVSGNRRLQQKLTDLFQVIRRSS